MTTIVGAKVRLFCICGLTAEAQLPRKVDLKTLHSQEAVIRTYALLALAACTSLMLEAQIPTISGCSVFPSDNVWNARVDSLPVHPNSAAYVQTVGLSSPAHPDFGHDSDNGIPYNLVPGNEKKVSVSFYYNGDPGPYPIPPNPLIEQGPNSTGDRHILIIDTTNCILYELFNAWPLSDGDWSAGSGAIFPLNSNNLRPSGWTSADAAGLPIFPGLVRYDEVAAGHIDHALRFTAPATQDSFVWPARHYASTHSGSQYPPMGTRFRLKADFDISPFPLHVQVILQALKTYGMFLADNGAPWFISGVPDSRWNDDEMHQLTHVIGADFEAVDESSLMVDPSSAEVTPQNPVLPSNGWFNIVSKSSGKCLDITGGPSATGPGIPVQQWGCWGGANQNFKFTPVTGGYEITLQSSGLQLDVEGGPTATQNGVDIIQYPYEGGTNEIWNLVPTSNGYVSIVAKSSGSCLDVRGESKDNGAAIQQWACWGGNNQQWTLVPMN